MSYPDGANFTSYDKANGPGSDAERTADDAISRATALCRKLSGDIIEIVSKYSMDACDMSSDVADFIASVRSGETIKHVPLRFASGKDREFSAAVSKIYGDVVVQVKNIADGIGGAMAKNIKGGLENTEHLLDVADASEDIDLISPDDLSVEICREPAPFIPNHFLSLRN